eukprot:422578-Hanusia_phi.AAC.1
MAGGRAQGWYRRFPHASELARPCAARLRWRMPLTHGLPPLSCLGLLRSTGSGLGLDDWHETES